MYHIFSAYYVHNRILKLHALYNNTINGMKRFTLNLTNVFCYKSFTFGKQMAILKAISQWYDIGSQRHRPTMAKRYLKIPT